MGGEGVGPRVESQEEVGEPLHQPYFVLGIFEVWSLELFAWGWL
jgi:hypothetical protein